MNKRLIPSANAALALVAVLLPTAAAAGTSGESVANVRDAAAGFSDPATTVTPVMTC